MSFYRFAISLKSPLIDFGMVRSRQIGGENMRDKNQFLVPAEAAPLLGWSPQWLRMEAHKENPNLPFPVSVVGTRTYIPRAPFEAYLRSIRGESNE